jgi:hypothetical protein
MKSDSSQWFALAAASLFLLGLNSVTRGGDEPAVPAHAAATQQSQDQAPASNAPKPTNSPSKVTAPQPSPSPAQSPAAPAAAPTSDNGTLSPAQSAALAQERLRRCRLHPGTCEQGKEVKPGKGESPEPSHSQE